jgi:hypothetical protein
MKHRHRLFVVAAVAVCALLAVAPAQAKKKPAASKRAMVASVSTEVTGSGQAAATVRSASSALLACYWAQVRRWGKNLLGMTLWTYYQRIEWCSNGSTITSVTRLRWGEVSFPGWAFKGHTSSTTSGGKGYTSYRARTHGHFCLAEYFSCVQNAYPWIDMTVRANGSWSYSAGG